MDKIKLTGLNFYGYHGCLPSERQMGQNYAEVYDVAKKIVEGEPRKLIEVVGEEIAQTILKDFRLVEKVRVTVHKPHAPLPGRFTDAAISVVRSRS